MQALGLIETRGLLAAVEGADAMLKAAEVTLLEKTYVGGGLVSIAVTGGVAAVKAAVEAGAAAVKQLGDTLLVSQHVIARPHDELDILILPIKPQKDAEAKNEKAVETNSVEEKAETVLIIEDMVVADAMIEDVIEKDTSIADTITEDTATEDAITEDTITEDTTTEDIIDEITTVVNTEVNVKADQHEEITLIDLNPEKIDKEAVDKIVLEYGIEKALDILKRLKVTKLRNLAREYKNLRIAGRVISKADKNVLIAEFKEYYRKN